ncbi:unnamed protein product, partial [Adineta ricciae]
MTLILFYFIVSIIEHGLTFNQPKFCPDAIWNSNGTIFSGKNILTAPPSYIFITSNNSIYLVSEQGSFIYIWLNYSVHPTIIITDNLQNPQSIFVQNENEIYIDKGSSNNTVERWILKKNTSVSVMNVPSSCYGLFIDINNNLYCSLSNQNQVVKKWLDDDSLTPIIVAGIDHPDSTSDALNSPNGIFVDVNLNLYVADTYNHRVQMFKQGQLHGKTVAGSTSNNITVTLREPTGVTLDGDGYLYIVDRHEARIVRGKGNRFRCILGCFSTGYETNRLMRPRNLAFDNSGNIYVSDGMSHQILKFTY